MKLRLIATVVTGAAAATLWSAAFGQANPQNSGYVLFGYGQPNANIWRIGSQAYNQKLSERRANAVRDYLVSKGVARDKIETLGMGKTQPVPGVVCNQAYPKERKALIECLAPNRRVEVEVKGEGKR